MHYYCVLLLRTIILRYYCYNRVVFLLCAAMMCYYSVLYDYCMLFVYTSIVCCYYDILMMFSHYAHTLLPQAIDIYNRLRPIAQSDQQRVLLIDRRIVQLLEHQVTAPFYKQVCRTC